MPWATNLTKSVDLHRYRQAADMACKVQILARISLKAEKRLK